MAEVGKTVLHFLKRAGLILLGVYFWIWLLGALLYLTVFASMVLFWLLPEWRPFGLESGFQAAPQTWQGLSGWELAWEMFVSLATIVSVGAIGWFYVFKEKQILRWTVVGLLIAVVFSSVALVTYSGPSLPADAHLKEMLRQHEESFRQLVELSNTDSDVARISPDFILLEENPEWPRPQEEWGISPERWDKYRELFETTGVKHGFGRTNDGIISRKPAGIIILFFVCYTRSLQGFTYTKGLAYLSEPPPEEDLLDLVESLDNPSALEIFSLRKLDDNWYLFLERAPY